MNDSGLLIAGIIAGALIYYCTRGDQSDDTQSESGVDAVMTDLDQVQAAANTAINGPVPVAGMSTSQAMLNMLQARESFSATPYMLQGETRYTWGYGHQGQPGETVPSSITQAAASVLFANDVVNRAEKWVKLYVTVPQTQQQFDALVSIAFNMSPQSFKKFADSVNAGNGIDGIAQQSVSWVASVYTNGIQSRRTAEMNVYDNGVYA
jgi:lysozyme